VRKSWIKLCYNTHTHTHTHTHSFIWSFIFEDWSSLSLSYSIMICWFPTKGWEQFTDAALKQLNESMWTHQSQFLSIEYKKENQTSLSHKYTYIRTKWNRFLVMGCSRSKKGTLHQ
jgi:hypothetical protein